MTEEAITFGAHHGLVGILTVPAAGALVTGRAVIVSNIGMHHRIGPYRIYVELARSLAACGFYVLRFDLAGMGDSAPRHDAPTPAARATRDLDDAMSWLTEHRGITEFVLVGLCSGVDSTHAVATQDPRVRAAAFIDGYAYPTAGFYLRHYLVRPFQLGRWIRFVQRRARDDRSLLDAATDESAVFVREFPSKAQFRRDIARMTARGLHLLFVYSGGVYYRVNSARQIYETLGAGIPRAQVEAEAMYGADHVFASVARRAELVARIVRWASSVPR